MRKLQCSLPSSILLKIYNSLILLYITTLHCSCSSKPSLYSTVILIQYILNKYTLIKLHDLYKLQLYKLFYRLCNNLLPLYFNSFYPTINRTNYNLRNESIQLPITRRTFYVQSTKYQVYLFLRTTLHKYSELADISA